VTDLAEISGLPLALEDAKLVFKDNLPAIEPDIRFLRDYQSVLASGSKLEGPEEGYYMYRGISLPEHKSLFQKFNYRYDITILKAGRVGREFLKTIGHYHPNVPGKRVTYPEVYEVLYGRAHYVCQKLVNERLDEFFVIEASPGDKVIIIPGYGHITINPGPEPLVMSNVTADGFSSIYEPFAKRKGAAFYELADGRWERNLHYEEIIPRRAVAIEVPEFGLSKDLPLYQSITKYPEKFDFLVNPDKYINIFKKAITIIGELPIG
jgi:glucose-6-phosphate isomerase